VIESSEVRTKGKKVPRKAFHYVSKAEVKNPRKKVARKAH